MPITVLGEGTFGIIIKVNENSAVKIISTWDESKGPTEFEIAQRVSHKNLLRSYDCTRDDLKRYPVKIRELVKRQWLQRVDILNEPLSYFHIRMELCNAGSLQDWIISAENQSRNLVTADKLFLQILQAVAALHRQKIVHGDLKPQNIFLHKISNSYIVKVGDFGDSFDEEMGPDREEFGTLEYKDESKGNDERITTKYDIYSLGLIYSILFMGSFLNFDKDLVHNSRTRKNALHNLLKSIKSTGSSKLINESHPKRDNFVRQLLIDVERRPDVFRATEKFSEIVKETNSSWMLSSVPGKNPLFQGRREILQEINEKISSSIYVLLHGLTGTGKKTIAAEYLHSKSESHKYKEILWFNCSSKKILKREYRNLQAEKNLKGPFRTETVLNWLNLQPGLAIVYVNVHSFSAIQYLMATDRKCGLVVCTSRINSDYWPEYFNKIKVDLLPEIDCSHLIYEAVTIINNETSTEKQIAKFKLACMFLSNQLGYSTTAIAQSFVYLRNKNRDKAEISISSLSKYVEYCQKNKYEVKRMQHDVIKLRKFEIGSIYKTLVSTIHQLSAVSSIAFKWLKICAYIDCQHIPEFMFDNFLEKNDAIQLKHETLSHLKYFSLLEYLSINNGSFVVSRVVQRVVQMYFASSFAETIENISRALSIPHLNGKGTTKIYWDSAYRVRTLQPHYETILNHVSDNKKPLTLTCCLRSNKKIRHLQEIEFSVQKALRHSYRSQSLRKETLNSFDEILILKENLYGNDSLIRGTTLMAKGKLMLGFITATKHSDNTKIDCVVKLFHDAERVLKECYNQNQNRIEIYQCYLYQAQCCALPIKDFHEKKKNEARDYLNKALEILVKAVHQKKNVLIPLCTTLKRIAENYSYLNEWVMMEKYLLVAFEISLLNDIDDNKLKILREIDNYEVTDELFEKTLRKWNRNRSVAYVLLKTFSRCYERQKNSIKKKFVADIHKQCKLSANRLGGAYQPRFAKFQHSPEKVTEIILESLPSLKESKKQSHTTVMLAEAQNKICAAKLLKGQQKIKEAIKYFNEGLDIYLQHRNNNDLSIAFIYEYLGECYSRLQDRKNACEMLEKCYQIFKSDQVIKKEKNIKFANLIQKYAKQLPIDRIQEKIFLLEECLPILISYSGANHNSVAFVNEKIGSLYLKMGNFEHAIVPLKEALKTYDNNKLPAGNQNRLSCLEKLCKTCEKVWLPIDEAKMYENRYENEKNDAKNDQNKVEKSNLLQKTKRKILVRNANKVKSIMNGTFY